MFTLVLLGCFSSTIVGSDLEERPRELLVVGAIHEDALITVPSVKRFTRATLSKKFLLSADFFVNNGISTCSDDFPPRWKISNNELILNQTSPWLGDFRARRCYTRAFPLSDIGKRKTEFDERTQSYAYTYGLGEGAWDESETPVDAIYSSMCGYVNEKFKVDNDRFPFQHYEFFFDILPGKRKFDMVVLADGPLQLEMEKTRKEKLGEMRVRTDEIKEPSPIYPRKIDKSATLKPMLGFWEKIDKQWVLTEKIEKPSFNERFWAYKVGTTYFFLTDSGKLYLARKPKEGDRKLEPIWDEKTKPIVGVISDSATDKVFLFGRNDKPAKTEAKGFYFELDEKPAAQPFDPAKANAARGDLLLTAAEYARFLHAEKKVKIPSLDK